MLSDIFEYDVFLSFASADEKSVKPIWQEMSLSGLRVFWSDETLKQHVGQSWIEVIQNALVQNRHFVLICTENSMQSEWVRDEYQTFYTQCHIPSKRKRRLILLKIKDFNLSSLPPFLRNLQLSDSVEHIISILGGVNIQALKQENNLLKQRIGSLNIEIERLTRETGYKSEAEVGGGAYVWLKTEWTEQKGAYWDEPGFEQTDDHPVTCVSWNDVKKFIEWLIKKEGKVYRLPNTNKVKFIVQAKSLNQRNQQEIVHLPNRKETRSLFNYNKFFFK